MNSILLKPGYDLSDAVSALNNHIVNITNNTLNRQEVAYMQQNCRIKHFKKRQLDTCSGDITKHLVFILKGAMRMYSVDEKGKEHTVHLAIENCWIYDHESLNKQTPTKFFIEAAENCTVLQFSAGHYKQFQLQVPLFRRMISLNNLNNLIAIQKRLYAAISMLADERYGQFIKATPAYMHRFSQNTIASYLGMTFETLSRIRKQYINLNISAN